MKNTNKKVATPHFQVRPLIKVWSFIKNRAFVITLLFYKHLQMKCHSQKFEYSLLLFKTSINSSAELPKQ